MTENRPLKVFLCHSSADKPAVRELYQKLCAEPWIDPWLDEEELYPGQDWEVEIEKAVETSDVVLVCLSNGSINKRGFVQKELRYALDVALEMPEETIFIVPLRLEECTPPRSLRDWQYADYFEGQRERAFQRLLVSLKRRADSLELEYEEKLITGKEEEKNKREAKEEVNRLAVQKTEEERIAQAKIESESRTKEYSKVEAVVPSREVVTPEKFISTSNKITLSNGMEFMRVPAGKFLMGSDNYDDNEKPQHIVDIPYDYWMARYPVTNEQYTRFKKKDFDKGKESHPVVQVSWDNLTAYCQWLNNLLKADLPAGLILRLPTEAEWEKAARGTDGLEYPWGNQFDKNKCNAGEGRKGDTTSVGIYSPQGDSPYGCADMSGNVWEWTHSLLKSYPYKANDGREDEKASGERVFRGGSFYDLDRNSRCTYRFDLRNGLGGLIGFRVVVASPVLS